MLFPTFLSLTLAASTTAALQGHSHSHSNLHKRDDYKDQCLTHHNIHRTNHSAPALTWSDSLASTAQKIASSCKFEHDVEMDGGGYGQNIASGMGQDNVSAVITELWYNDEMEAFGNQYGMQTPGMENFELWGHWSQIVWKGSREVGCATQ